jgi:hypothetical protein
MTTRNRSRNSRDRLRKVQLSFYVEPDDYRALKEISHRTGIPQQVFMRRGLSMILQREGVQVGSPDRRLKLLKAFQADLEVFMQCTAQLIERVRPLR